MKKMVHAYMGDELYAHCSVLAGELGLSTSGFLNMLVSNAWNEKKGGAGGGGKAVLPAVERVVLSDQVEKQLLKPVEDQDREFEELVQKAKTASKPVVIPTGRYPKSGRGRHRHLPKEKEE